MTAEGAGSKARLARCLAADQLRLTSATPPPVELFRLDVSDAEEVFRVEEANREHLRTWLGWVDATVEAANVRDFIAESRGQTLDEGRIVWGIQHGGELVGVISFHGIPWDESRASLGYWLAKTAEGRGIAASALGAVIDFGFRTLGLRTLSARIAPGNTRSAALVRRHGFQVVGLIEQVSGFMTIPWRTRSSSSITRGRALHAPHFERPCQPQDVPRRVLPRHPGRSTRMHDLSLETSL